MKQFRWALFVGGVFICISALFYQMQIQLFHSPRDTFFYLFQDLAFLPIQVLLVTMIIDRLLTVREKRVLLKKMNMVIGVFYSEVGASLLRIFYELKPEAENIGQELLIDNGWTSHVFLSKSKTFRTFPYKIEINPGSLQQLKTFLLSKRGFLLVLLENPNLLEHDSFTDLLWAVFHLTDELNCRETLENLPESDLSHLKGDIKRAKALLISEWLTYLKHLKEDYPYLFSLEIRKNPFNPQASPVVRYGERDEFARGAGESGIKRLMR